MGRLPELLTKAPEYEWLPNMRMFVVSVIGADGEVVRSAYMTPRSVMQQRANIDKALAQFQGSPDGSNIEPFE